MLALVLAATVAQQADVVEFLRECDRPSPTAVCRAYVGGFVDAVVAQQHIARTTKTDVEVAPLACTPGSVDMARVRSVAVGKFRASQKVPLYLGMMAVLNELYPCAVPSRGK